VTYKQAQKHYGIQGRSAVLAWLRKYNTFRPHSCLGDMTPEMFIEKQVKGFCLVSSAHRVIAYFGE